MGSSQVPAGEAWMSFLGDDRESAIARVESEWERYLTEMECRAINAGRFAERQVRLYRARESERLDTLRELEIRIARASTAANEQETEVQRRVELLDASLAQRERNLAELNRAIEEKERALHRATRGVSESNEENTRVQLRLQSLYSEEREAKERIILIQSKGDVQLKECEAKLRAIHCRMNVIVAEAANKVRRLQDVEKELTLRVGSLKAELHDSTGIKALYAPTPPQMLPVRGGERPKTLDCQTTSQDAAPNRGATATALWSRGGKTELASPESPKVSSMELGDVSIMLGQLEDQFRDSLVEAAAKDFSATKGNNTDGLENQCSVSGASSNVFLQF